MTSTYMESIRARIKRLTARRRSRITSARYDTSDVVQETWLQVWRQLADYGEYDENSVAISDAQIACYAKGHAAKMFRKHTAGKRDASKDIHGSKVYEFSGTDPLVHVDTQDQFEALCKAVDDLHPVSKAFVVSYYFDQLSLRQIGQELDMSIDKVRSLKKKVIRDLRVRLTRKTNPVNYPD